ncbi:MAG: hypothetical protein CMJ25_27220 [Phycisphaerae bacterium]|nr:hypothetical protein [Phycisphaerae bacterium]
MGAPTDDCVFTINREFYDKSVDPQTIMSLVTLLDRQIVSSQDIFDRLKSGGLIDADRTLDDVRDELGDLSPLE